MSIVNYTELRSAIQTWLGHTLFSGNVADFITLFEASANRKLRVRQMETTTTLTPSSGVASLPSDFLAHRYVKWAGDLVRDLEYVVPSVFIAGYPSSPTGIPNIFTIEGSSLKVMPISDENLVLSYFQKIPVLSDTNADNWLLLAHPDLYLFGSLCEAEMFGVNDERAALWKRRRDECFEEVEKLSNKSRGVGSIQILGMTP